MPQHVGPVYVFICSFDSTHLFIVHVCHSMSVEIRGQLLRVCSLLLPFGSQVLNWDRLSGLASGTLEPLSHLTFPDVVRSDAAILHQFVCREKLDIVQVPTDLRKCQWAHRRVT